MAGTYYTHDGRDVAQEVGAELSGVSDEARRAMRHLGLGDWSSLTVETDAAVVAMAPMRDDSLVLVAASKASPLGLVHRVLDRCVARAAAWLGKGAA
jgi:predicted regulator of Ras-like GTPase activity (Roadblock/LC7/MglB family)